MTTYTYPADRGPDEARHGLTASEVAIERLTYDGHNYELRREADGAWMVYGSTRSRNAPGGAGEMVPMWDGRHLLVSHTAATEAEAWKQFVPRIVEADWQGIPTAMTDDDYREMMAELAADAAEADD